MNTLLIAPESMSGIDYTGLESVLGAELAAKTLVAVALTDYARDAPLEALVGNGNLSSRAAAHYASDLLMQRSAALGNVEAGDDIIDGNAFNMVSY